MTAGCRYLHPVLISIKKKKLLKELALYLGKNGSMKSDKFLEFVEKYGNKLTPEFMKEVREKNDNFYFDVLNDLEVE